MSRVPLPSRVIRMVVPAVCLAIAAVLPPPGLLGRFGDPQALNGRIELSLSPDGRFLLVGESAALYDVARGRKVPFDPPDDLKAATATFTPAGRLFILGPQRGSLFDPATGKVLRTFNAVTKADSDELNEITLAADEAAVAFVWDRGGPEIEVVRADGSALGPAIRPGKGCLMALSGDGRRLAFLTDGKDEDEVATYDVPTGKLIGKVPVHNPDDHYIAPGLAVFSPDGNTLAHYDPDCGLVLYAARGGVRATSGITKAEFLRLEYARDGKTILAWTEKGDVVSFDPDTAREVGRRTVKPAAGKGVKLWDQTADGRTTLVHTAADPVRVWVDGTIRLELPYQDTVDEVGWGPTGPVILRGGRRHDWDPGTGRVTERAATDADGLALTAGGYPVNVRILDPLGKTPTAEVVELATGRVVFRAEATAKYEHCEPAAAVGHGLLARTLDDHVVVCDLATGKERFRWEDPSGQGTSALTFTPDGRFLLCGLTPCYVKRDGGWFAEASLEVGVVELATGTLRRSIFLPVNVRHMPRIRAIWTDAKGRTALVSLTGAAVVLDLRTGRVTAEHAGNFPCAFSPDGRWVMLEGGGLWDLRHPTRPPILLSPDGLTAAGFSADSRGLVVGKADGTATAWDLTALTAFSDRRAARAVPTLDQLWSRLGEGEVEAALTELAARPGAAVALVAARLKPATAADPRAVREQIARLDAPRFADREAATRWLADAGEQTESELRKSLADKPSAEKQKRLERLLAEFDARLTTVDHLRGMRAVELLERLGTPEARAVLDALVGGAPGARLTAAAQAARGRLDP